MKGSVEVRVGLFVTATLALLLFFLFMLGDYRLGGGLEVFVDFHFSGSLSSGAPVKISGVRIGKVTALSYVAGQQAAPPLWKDDSNTPIQVRATVEIDKQYQDILTSKSDFMISQAGIFGEPYLELLRGDGGPVKSGQLYRGRDALRLDVLISTVSSLVTDLNLEQMDLDAVGTLLRDGSSLVRTVQRVIVNNEDEIPTMIENANQTLVAVKKLADNGDLIQILRNTKSVTAKFAAKTDSLLGSAQGVIDEAHVAMATVKKAEPIIEAINPKQLSQIIDTTGDTMDNLQGASKDLKDLTQQVKRGQGTIGALMMDPELYKSLVEFVEDIKKHPWKVLWRK